MAALQPKARVVATVSGATALPARISADVPASSFDSAARQAPARSFSVGAEHVADRVEHHQRADQQAG
jgi:hypothetical protein